MNYFVFISTRSTLIAVSLVLLCLTTGCASSHIETGQRDYTSTAVSLTGKNYRLIQGGAQGESYGFRLLGIIPLASPHYANAKRALYASVKEPLTGKAIALINEMEDKSTLYLILFSVPKMTVTADVIEFTGQPEGK